MKFKDYNKKLYPYKIMLMIYKIIKQIIQICKNNNNKKLKIRNNLFKSIKINLIKSNKNSKKIKRNLKTYLKESQMKFKH